MEPPQSPNQEGPSQPPPQLPEGWLAQWDSHSRKYYYVQRATGHSQWEVPTQPALSVPTPEPTPQAESPFNRPAESQASPGPEYAGQERGFITDLATSALGGGKHGKQSSGLGGIASSLLSASGNHGSQGQGGAGGIAGQLIGSILGGGKQDHSQQQQQQHSWGGHSSSTGNNYGSSSGGAQQSASHQGGQQSGGLLGAAAGLLGGRHSHQQNANYGYTSSAQHSGGYSGPAPPATYTPGSQGTTQQQQKPTSSYDGQAQQPSQQQYQQQQQYQSANSGQFSGTPANTQANSQTAAYGLGTQGQTHSPYPQVPQQQQYASPPLSQGASQYPSQPGQGSNQYHLNSAQGQNPYPPNQYPPPPQSQNQYTQQNQYSAANANQYSQPNQYPLSQQQGSNSYPPPPPPGTQQYPQGPGQGPTQYPQQSQSQPPYQLPPGQGNPQYSTPLPGQPQPGPYEMYGSQANVQGHTNQAGPYGGGGYPGKTNFGGSPNPAYGQPSAPPSHEFQQQQPGYGNSAQGQGPPPPGWRS